MSQDKGAEMMVLGSNILSPWLIFEYRGHFNCTRVILKNMAANFGNIVWFAKSMLVKFFFIKRYTLSWRWKLQFTLLQWKKEQFLLVAWIAR